MIPFLHFTDAQVFFWFVKALSFVLAFLYILYSFVIFGQTRSLARAIKTDGGMFITLVSFFQLSLAITIFFLIFFL